MYEIDNYICPFKFSRSPWHAEHSYCHGMKCAWWDKKTGKCVIHGIAQRLEVMDSE